ncbi:MAG: helix-turn-helix domain-containing protein [Planctomycetota bacterium]|jgi:DNA-binding IclR family transcriptional regulator|nr:helix-turn-helix domain-containing protein [Planctomycetota bacterium]
MANDAPALTRGLRLLETIAAEADASFSDLQRLCPIPKASLARLLAVLRDEGYVIKHGDGYRLGDRTSLFQGGRDADEHLRLVAEPHLRRVAESCGHTTILIRIHSDRFHCLAREIVEDSVVLQGPGTTRDDFGNGPWGSIAMAGLDTDKYEQARGRMRNRDAFETRFPHERCCLAEHGYVRADYNHVCRIAVPIAHAQHAAFAALGIGAPPDAMSEQAAQQTITAMQAAAADIATHCRSLFPHGASA